MKKIVLLSVACLCVIFVHAQLRLELQGGLNLSNSLIKTGSSFKLNTNPAVGHQLGVTSNLHLGSNFYLKPGIGLIRKSTKIETNAVNSRGEAFNAIEQVDLNYIFMPVDICFRSYIGAAPRFIFAGVGVNASYALSGRYYRYGEGGSLWFMNEGSMRVGANEDINPWEFGVNFNIGYNAGKAGVKLFYNLGISDVTARNSVTWKNRVIGLSLCYALRR